MDSQPSVSPRPAIPKVPSTAGTGEAEGFLFPPDDRLIRSVLDLTRQLESLGVIEIVVDEKTGAEFYRILKRGPGRRSRFHAQETARRIGAIFGRRTSTPWGKDEIEAFKANAAFDELELVEAYYKSEAKKPDNYCRRSLITFLRHYPGEVDRARRWQETSSRKHCY